MKRNQILPLFAVLIAIFYSTVVSAQTVDYSVVSVDEESGIDFMKITSESDYVLLPVVYRSNNRINWESNRIISVSPNGNDIAYLSERRGTANIFIKSLDKQGGGSVQRTNRSKILDFTYSPDGNYICFSEKRGKVNQIFQTSATNGYVCREITNGNLDYSPIYSSDIQNIFFARQELNGVSIWSYNIQNNFLSNYTTGMNPYPIDGESSFLCTKINNEGRGEIWKVNYATGVEECIISDMERSFTSPMLSPDGQWILFVGSSKIIRNINKKLASGQIVYLNTDIYVVRIDGTNLHQITYHAADDLSPVWSKDGKWIYFISQRGSAEGIANIWRMTFSVE